MSIVITGASGLIGAEITRALLEEGHDVVGVDNDLRRRFRGDDASTYGERRALEVSFERYSHWDVDLRRTDAFAEVLRSTPDVELVVHAAAQTSARYAIEHPAIDFQVNATATMHVVEAAHVHAPEAVLIHLSSADVYGGFAGTLPLLDGGSRYDLPRNHRLWNGLHEGLATGVGLRGLSSTSRLAADLWVREYAAAHGLEAMVFRLGYVTGPLRPDRVARGFLARLTEGTLAGRPILLRDHGGKQVTDVLHVKDVTAAILSAYRQPRPGAVYNLGGGRSASFSPVEAVGRLGEIIGRDVEWSAREEEDTSSRPRWSVCDTSALWRDFPSWRPSLDLDDIFEELIAGAATRT